jgi:hypothetical protein
MVVTDVAGGLSIYFHPEALPAFSEIAQKLPSTSFIPENLFPSISARYGLQKIRVESCPFSDLKNHSLLLNLHHQSSPADRDYMVLPEVGLAFLRMFLPLIWMIFRGKTSLAASIGKKWEAAPT